MNYKIGENPKSRNGFKVGHKVSKATRLKISRSHKGVKLSEKHVKSLKISHLGKKLSIETRRKMSEAKKGNKGSNWQGGKTEKTRLLRITIEYKLWREAVFKRDNYTCIWCGARNGNGRTIVLNADHIKPWSDYPELRFAIDNGRTLCIECHRKTSTFGPRRKDYV